MKDRTQMSADFLMKSGWDEAHRTCLAGDASARSYDRLELGENRAVLMNAPPDQDDSMCAFLQVSDLLASTGFSSPKILARDIEAGFLLLEDLGDDLFARLCDSEPSIETSLYKAAIDVLCELHEKCKTDGLPPYDIPTYLREARLLVEWYIPAATGNPFDQNLAHEFDALIETACHHLEPVQPVTVLRDFHSENLLWLPNRKGTQNVGLLDYQDALAGHPAYDLVSLLEDARRDTSPDLQKSMFNYFAQKSGKNSKTLQRDYDILGMQRNAKILGIFVRLWIRDKKPAYIDLLPRVWAHFQRDLQQPALDPIKFWVEKHCPAPDSHVLENIREISHET